MTRLKRHLRAACLLASIGALSGTAQALSIQASVTDQGGFFRYLVSVVNDDPIADLLTVSLLDAPLGDPLIPASLAAPIGFLASYDSGLGFVDLIADGAGAFPPGVLTGFLFDSLSAPNSAFTRFEALDLNGNLFSGSVDSNLVGQVDAPRGLALLLLGLGLLWRPYSSQRSIPRSAS